MASPFYAQMLLRYCAAYRGVGRLFHEGASIPMNTKRWWIALLILALSMFGGIAQNMETDRELQ
jgi:hypothetical protein